MSLMVTYSTLQPEKEVCLRQLNARDHRFAVLRNRNVSARDRRPVWCVKGKCTQLHSTCVYIRRVSNALRAIWRITRLSTACVALPKRSSVFAQWQIFQMSLAALTALV